ncbi:DUF7940 domain-containing protein [Nitrosovibrio sp. Nv4]|uniref:DUF7940 domain-containing protein n=1 Tax=Nitrosovibrio sp. Nv4 TaxID=1945880 RepID=UPI000BD993F7|nr:hypothetical protein [Nitrosovibrio sp. Nv4]SOD42360.1 hypothetical protein SAMN06298226_2699 [Nitrosovibrio sp. Nv4]
MKLVENWKVIMTKAWSVRLAAIAALIISASESVHLLPTGVFGITPEALELAAPVLKYLGYLIGAIGAFLARPTDQGIAVAQIKAALDAAKNGGTQ